MFPIRGCPIRAELLDVNINTLTQNINTRRTPLKAYIVHKLRGFHESTTRRLQFTSCGSAEWVEVSYLLCSCKTPSDLRRHRESHNAVFAYQCTVEGCGFTARAMQTLKRHHTVEHQVSQLLSTVLLLLLLLFLWQLLTLSLLERPKVANWKCPVFPKSGQKWPNWPRQL